LAAGVYPLRIDRQHYNGEGRVELFSLFFIDIIKVTEVQYAILIINMNRLKVEPLNITALKQTIMSYSRLMYDLEKQIHNQQTQVHSQRIIFTDLSLGATVLIL
jgi:hypothetical protein